MESGYCFLNKRFYDLAYALLRYVFENTVTENIYSNMFSWDFLSDSVVKNPPANAGDASLIPGSGRPLTEENGNPCHSRNPRIPAWNIPGIDEPSGLQSKGSQSQT